MYIPLSHFDLALTTTPGVVQQRIRRPLLVPKAEPPQAKSPPDTPAHEIGTFCVARNSNDPFNTTWCWPRSSELDSVLFCPALLSHPPSPQLPHGALSVCFICHMSGCQQPDLQPQQISSALLKSTSLGSYSSSPRMRTLEH